MKQSIYRSTLYFALGLVLVGGLLGACSGGSRISSSSSPTTPTGGADTAANTVNVTTTEMEFRFDPMPTQAGRITFVVTNHGKIEHNFVVQGQGRDYATKMIPPGSSETLTVDLAPGTYNFVCAVLGHNFAGMQGSFTLS